MEEKTKVFKIMASKAKHRQWISFCDTLNRDATLTHFWQFYRQMEGCAANTTIPDLVDDNGAVLNTSEETGSVAYHSNAQSNRAIRTIWMKGKWSGKCQTNSCQKPAQETVDQRPGVHRSTCRTEQGYSSSP